MHARELLYASVNKYLAYGCMGEKEKSLHELVIRDAVRVVKLPDG